MVAIKQTDTIIPESNYSLNNVHILIGRKENARELGYDWKEYNATVWDKYQIKESDMRSKTATFTTPQYLDLTTGVYPILITTPLHEDFSGVILSVEIDLKNGLYNYQCQDWSRYYQSKFGLVDDKHNMHRILQWLITKGGVPLVGAVSKAKLKEYKEILSGLRPASHYQQGKETGSIIRFNPMTQRRKMIMRDKSFIEAIRALVFGSGAYIDVYFNKYGVIQIEPYTKNEFMNTGLVLSNVEFSGLTQKFDTTNIITGAVVKSTDRKRSGTFYGSADLVNLDLSAFFGKLDASVDNPNQSTTTVSASKGKTKVSKKQSNTAKKTTNPYGKKKKVWINSDNINGSSSDWKFMKDVASLLNKNGWKTKIVGLGPNTHTEGYMGPKNGIWFCIYGGADAAVFRECCTNNSYTNKLKSLNSRTVIGMHGGGDIRKGGKYYKWLGRAHDDDYSPSGFSGISYPLNMLTKNKVPIMYANTAKQMVSKFLAGGDNPKAC